MTVSAPNAFLTVIVPVFNRCRFLRRAVGSVLSAPGETVEVLIVDDGSTDESLPLAKSLAGDSGGKIRVVRHPDGGNHGAAASRNAGIRAARGEWIAFLDSDDYYLPNRFAATHVSLLRTPGVDAVYGTAKIVYEDGSSADGLGWEGEVFGITTPVTGRELLSRLVLANVWPMSGITVRRELLLRCGLFDTSFRTSEDCNLWFRLASLGTILPADLAAPVAAYVRHSANTYYPGAGPRVEFLRAVGCALGWARRTSGVHDYAIPTLRGSFRDRTVNDIVELRKRGETQAAWRCVVLAARHDLRGFLRIPLLRQVQALARETLHLSRGLKTSPTP